MDIYFDTKDKVLVVTDGKGEFHDARIWQTQCSPRCRQKVWLLNRAAAKSLSFLADLHASRSRLPFDSG